MPWVAPCGFNASERVRKDLPKLRCIGVSRLRRGPALPKRLIQSQKSDLAIGEGFENGLNGGHAQ